MTAKTTQPTMPPPTPKSAASAGSTTPAPTTHPPAPMEVASGRAHTSPQARIPTISIDFSPAGSKTGRDHDIFDAQDAHVSATNLPGDQNGPDTQRSRVAGDQDQQTAIPPAEPTAPPPSAVDHPQPASDHSATKAAALVGGDEQGQRATKGASTPTVDASLADPFLALAADILDDLETVRKANENRLRQLTRTEVDKDGEERGFGLTVDHPGVARLASMVAAMLCESKAVLAVGIEKPKKTAGCCLEHDAERNLTKMLEKHRLYPWAKAQKGVGDKQFARLLAAIGDPYIRPEMARKDGTVEPARPRTVSELWAYTGYHVIFPADHGPTGTHSRDVGGEQTGHPDQTSDGTQGKHVGVAPKRARGQRANWSTTAKMRAYLIAESCIKQRTSPFRVVYDDARTKYADAVHDMPCVRCGPAGNPAPAGSPLSDGHKHARAMRAVSKALLKELWRESKRLHESNN